MSLPRSVSYGIVTTRNNTSHALHASIVSLTLAYMCILRDSHDSERFKLASHTMAVMRGALPDQTHKRQLIIITIVAIIIVIMVGIVGISP